MAAGGGGRGPQTKLDQARKRGEDIQEEEGLHGGSVSPQEESE